MHENFDHTTSKFHIWYNDTLTDTVDHIAISKQVLVGRSVSHLSQKLYSIADQLQIESADLQNAICGQSQTSLEYRIQQPMKRKVQKIEEVCLREKLPTRSYFNCLPHETSRFHTSVTNTGKCGANSSPYFCAYIAMLSQICDLHCSIKPASSSAYSKQHIHIFCNLYEQVK